MVSRSSAPVRFHIIPPTLKRARWVLLILLLLASPVAAPAQELGAHVYYAIMEENYYEFTICNYDDTASVYAFQLSEAPVYIQVQPPPAGFWEWQVEWNQVVWATDWNPIIPGECRGGFIVRGFGDGDLPVTGWAPVHMLLGGFASWGDSTRIKMAHTWGPGY